MKDKLDLVVRLQELGFGGPAEAAAYMLEYFGLSAEMPVGDLNRWLQTRLARINVELLGQEGSCEVSVTPGMTAAALGLALLTGEATGATIQRVRRGIDI